jgi:hypothetical protein
MKRCNIEKGLAIPLLCMAAFLADGVGAQQPKGAPAPAAAPPASSGGGGGGVFRCVDADGRTEYRNVGDTKGCKRVETDAVNTVPFPRAAGTPSTQPRGNTRVDAGAQRGRDNDRRRILEDELASEEKRLADLRQEFNNGEPERRGDERNYQRYLDRVERLKADIARSEANVESLKRELGTARN